MTVYLGDCLSILPTLDAGSVDCVIADPPYGTTANRWDAVIPFAPLWAELHRVAKPTAAFVFTASQPFTSALVMSNPREFRHEWVWIKNRGSNFANTVREPMKEHESVVVFSRGGWTYNAQRQERAEGGRSRVGYAFNSDVAQQTTNYGALSGQRAAQLPELRGPSTAQRFNCEVGLHPTQKPVDLLAYLIRTYTNPGDTVLDFCAGACSTGVACIREGRGFVGIEEAPDYFKIGEARLAHEAARGRQLALEGA